jgi:hippurate hydrolase
MQGSIRAYSDEILEEVIEKVRLVATNTAETFGCKAEVDIIRLYPATVNAEVQAGHVERLARKWFGDDHFSKEDIPITASEDFSYFLQKR